MTAQAYDGQPTFRPVRVVDEAPRFAQLWDCVLFDEQLSSNAKVIYAVLQRMAYEAHGADLAPSMKRIAERANIKDRETVASCLRQLEERGHIKRVPRTKWEADVISLTQPTNHRAEKTRNDAEETRTDHAENSRTSYAEKTRNLIETNELETNEETIPPLPPKPFDLWESFCRATDRDYRQATTKAKEIALKDAKALVADGITAEDVAGCARYMQSQSWRTGILTFGQMAGFVGEWRMSGRREHDPPPRSNKPRQPSFRDVTQQLQQMEDANHGRTNGEDAGVREAGRTWGPWGYLDDDPIPLLEQDARDGDAKHGAHGKELASGTGGVIEARHRVRS